MLCVRNLMDLKTQLLCCRLEENDSLVLTPFEKNLDIWRQLWRVVERSDLVCFFTYCGFLVFENSILMLHAYTFNICFVKKITNLATILQLVMVVDARDPLFYRCPDLEVYLL